VRDAPTHLTKPIKKASDWNLQEGLRRFTEQESPYRFIAEPATIAALFAPDSLFALSPGKKESFLLRVKKALS